MSLFVENREKNLKPLYKKNIALLNNRIVFFDAGNDGNDQHINSSLLIISYALIFPFLSE